MSNAITTIALATLAIVEFFSTDHDGPEIEPFWAGCRYGLGYCDCSQCKADEAVYEAELERWYASDRYTQCSCTACDYDYERRLDAQLNAMEADKAERLAMEAEQAERNSEWQASGQTITEFLAGRLAA